MYGLHMLEKHGEVHVLLEFEASATKTCCTKLRVSPKPPAAGWHLHVHAKVHL